MTFIIIFMGIFAIIFIGLCVFGLINQAVLKFRGKVVDARVINCNRSYIEIAGRRAPGNYSALVEFYGDNGEIIQKNLAFDQPVSEGTTIRCRYDKKKDWLMKDEDVNTKNVFGLIFMIPLVLIITGITPFFLYLMWKYGTIPVPYFHAIVYFICILLVLISIWGIVKKIQFRIRLSKMQAIPGYLVEFTESYRRNSYHKKVIIYQPYYEYEIMGMKYRYKGKVSGSNSIYCTIGRQVTMLFDPKSGKVVCKEEEKTGSNTMILAGVFGILLYYAVFIK